jgi:hypothetical protein
MQICCLGWWSIRKAGAVDQLILYQHLLYANVDLKKTNEFGKQATGQPCTAKNPT